MSLTSHHGQRPIKPLRLKEALRSQIVTASNQINDEARLRRIAQYISREWIAEHGGELILKEGPEA